MSEWVHEACEERDVKDSGQWKVARVGLVCCKKERKASHGEENVDERCVCVVRPLTSVHECEQKEEAMENGKD